MSETKHPGGRPLKYPWDTMAVMDNHHFTENRASVSVSARQYGTRHGKRFAVRKTKTGFRVWRVA